MGRVSIVSNRVLRVAPDGAQSRDRSRTPIRRTWSGSRPPYRRRRRWAGPHLDRAAGRVLRNISSLAFGGPDLRTAYLGCLLDDASADLRSRSPGIRRRTGTGARASSAEHGHDQNRRRACTGARTATAPGAVERVYQDDAPRILDNV